jgi:hypothetical protein
LGCSSSQVTSFYLLPIHKGGTDSSQEDLWELQEKYLRTGLWKERMVFVRMRVTPAERDGEKLSVDDTPRDASS